jgi:YfiH family protein
MPPFDTTHHLSTLKGVKHGFFGRRGGVSTGIYAGLNVGLGSGDTARSVRTNRHLVRDALGAATLQSCYQVHGNHCLLVTDATDTRAEADAMVTQTPGLALCILTADCVPVLFADAQAGIVGAAHAGWKGALAGICQSTLKMMEGLGADRTRITAAIGPAIQQPSYEVGPELRDQILSVAEWSAGLFHAGQGDRLHFDLPGFVRSVLLREGVGAIDHHGADTCAEAETYFSNRRRHRLGEPDYGRNGSVIVLCED